MRNPRPCWACGRPKSAHGNPAIYTPAKRTEPLRAGRGGVSASGYMPESHRGNYRWERSEPLIDPSTLRKFLDAERQHLLGGALSPAYLNGALTELERTRRRFC